MPGWMSLLEKTLPSNLKLLNAKQNSKVPLFAALLWCSQDWNLRSQSPVKRLATRALNMLEAVCVKKNRCCSSHDVLSNLHHKILHYPYKGFGHFEHCASICCNHLKGYFFQSSFCKNTRLFWVEMLLVMPWWQGGLKVMYRRTGNPICYGWKKSD